MLDEQSESQLINALKQNKINEAYSFVRSLIDNANQDKCNAIMIGTAYQNKELVCINNLLNFPEVNLSTKCVKYLFQKFYIDIPILDTYLSDAEVFLQFEVSKFDKLILVFNNSAILCLSIVGDDGLPTIKRQSLEVERLDKNELIRTANDFLDQGFLQVICSLFLAHAIQHKTQDLIQWLITFTPKITPEIIKSIQDLDATSIDVNKKLLDYMANSDNYDLFICLLLKPTVPDQNTITTASDKIREFLNYKPGKKQRSTYEYCNSDKFDSRLLRSLIDDFNNTSDDESSDEEYVSVENSIINLLRNNDTLVNLNDLKNRDVFYINKYNKNHKKSFHKSHDNNSSFKIMRDLYENNMHMILFRGIHRGPKCIVKYIKLTNKAEIKETIIQLKKSYNNKSIYLLSLFENTWYLYHLVQNNLYEYPIANVLPQDLQDSLQAYQNSSIGNIDIIVSQIRQFINKKSKSSLLSNDSPKSTFSPELQQTICDSKKDLFDIEKSDALLDNDIVKHIEASHIKFVKMARSNTQQDSTSYYQFFDDYVKKYNELFNCDGIRKYGFNGNPIISTSHRCERAFFYASGMRNKNSNNRMFPHYRQVTGKPKHRSLGVMRVYVIDKFFLEKHSESIAELIAKQLVRPGDRKSYEAEVVIKAFIPRQFFIADIPIYLPDVSQINLDENDYSSLYERSSDKVFEVLDKVIEKILPRKFEVVFEDAIKKFIWSRDITKVFYSPLSFGYIDKRLYYPTKARERYNSPWDHLTMSQSSHTQEKTEVTFDFKSELTYIAENFLLKPFPNNKPRKFHGVLHGCRVAIWALLLKNFLSKHEPELVQDFDDTNIELLQLLCLFHDAGREGEGKDHWEQESQDIYNHYINKYEDYFSTESIELTANSIVDKDKTSKDDNMFTAILHDADCIDYMRCVSTKVGKFELEKLRIYRKFLNNQTALEELEKLLYEISGIIHSHGDIYYDFVIEFTTRETYFVTKNFKPETKKAYEVADCHSILIESILKNHPICRSLYDGTETLLLKRTRTDVEGEDLSDDEMRKQQTTDDEDDLSSSAVSEINFRPYRIN